MESNVRLFYSYAHEDEHLRNDLEKHLMILKRQEYLKDWYDLDISAGNEWEKEITNKLDESDIILLLISPDFISSDYCWGEEMQRALMKHDNGEAVVIPVILRPVDGWENTPFGKLKAIPKDGKPVTTWDNMDEAFKNIACEIRHVLMKLNKNKK